MKARGDGLGLELNRIEFLASAGAIALWMDGALQLDWRACSSWPAWSLS